MRVTHALEAKPGPQMRDDTIFCAEAWEINVSFIFFFFYFFLLDQINGTRSIATKLHYIQTLRRVDKVALWCDSLGCGKTSNKDRLGRGPRVAKKCRSSRWVVMSCSFEYSSS